MVKCLRQRLAWCNRTGESYNLTSKQHSIYPHAISDELGNPHRGTKANWTDKLGKRYSSANPRYVQHFTRWVGPRGSNYWWNVPHSMCIITTNINNYTSTFNFCLTDSFHTTSKQELLKSTWYLILPACKLLTPSIMNVQGGILHTRQPAVLNT